MAGQTPRLLIVEDDADSADLLRETLADHFGEDRCTHVLRVDAALALDPYGYDLVLCDMNLPDGSGLDVLAGLQDARRDLPIVMVTSESELDVAISAIHAGADDYVVKAGDYLFTVPLVVAKNLAYAQMKRENQRLQDQLTTTLQQLQDKNAELESYVQKLAHLAATDPLTELANRRAISDQLEQAFAEAARYGQDLACAMIDLDGFKQVNDTLGHQAGDRLLHTAARVVRANCRASDMAGRYGGDEFVLLLPQTDPDTAANVVNRVRADFQEAIAPLVGKMPCDMSVGLACVSLSRPASADQLVCLADAALYRAKEQGKGRVCIHHPSDCAPNGQC